MLRSNPSKTDNQTTFHFIPYFGIQARQTDKLSNMSSLILESKHGRPFHVTPHTGIYARQTDKLHFISPLIGIQVRQTFFIPQTRIRTRQTDKLFNFTPHVCVSDRRTNVASHSIYWHPSTTD